MPKNASKTGKSSKTARVLSLLTDPAASLLGGSRNNREDGQDDATEIRGASKAGRGLDDAATESRIQASLEAEEDSLMGLFGKKEPSRPQRAAPQPEAPPAPPPQNDIGDGPDPQTLELLSMFSNPSTLGNSAMPTFAGDEEPPRPAALDFDFADELTAGMAEQPVPEPEPEPDWPPQPAQQAAPQPVAPPPAQQAAPPAPQYVPQAAPQPAMSLEKQAAPQYIQQPAPQPMQQPTPQPVQQAAPQYAQQPTPQPAPQYAQPAAPPAPQPVQRAAPQPAQQAPPQSSPAQHPATAHDYEQFVCFNLTQALVEEKADKLMKQFGMCTCNRCKVDVTAIALSNLPAKYVAMQNRDILPLLSMYEERYSAAVTVQVMSACRMVMKRPHHGR